MGPKFIRNLEAHLRQAEGRRPKAWERERSEQHSTRSVFISEWTLAGGPYVYSTQSTLARSIFINTRGQLSLREIQKSWGKFQKESRKIPEKSHYDFFFFLLVGWTFLGLFLNFSWTFLELFLDFSWTFLELFLNFSETFPGLSLRGLSTIPTLFLNFGIYWF